LHHRWTGGDAACLSMLSILGEGALESVDVSTDERATTGRTECHSLLCGSVEITLAIIWAAQARPRMATFLVIP
jgi:hypothetical protein